MANEFVGAEYVVSGRANAPVGSVCVVIKNGLPDRVVEPGKRFSRGFGAPLVGNLTILPITTDSVGIGFTIDDAMTGDMHPVGVTLRTRVRINPVRNYASLKGFIIERGATFAEDLIIDLETSLEGWVRERIAGFAHAALRQKSVREALTTTLPLSLGREGLLTVTAFTVESVTWSDKAVELEDEEHTRAIELTRESNRAAVAIMSASNEAQLGLHKLEAYRELAQVTGRPLEWLAFPEHERVSREAAMEIVTKLLEPGNRSLWSRDPGMLKGLFAAAGVSLPTNSVAAVQSPMNRAAARQLSSDAPTETIVETAVHVPLAQLSTNSRMLRGWLKTHNDRPAGIDGARTSTEATVIAVGTEPGSISASPDYGHVFGDLPVTVLGLKLDTVEGLVNQWIRLLTGGGSVEAGVNVDENVATVALYGDPGEVRALLKRLDDPSSSAPAALEELLELDSVRLIAGS